MSERVRREYVAACDREGQDRMGCVRVRVCHHLYLNELISNFVFPNVTQKVSDFIHDEKTSCDRRSEQETSMTNKT